MLKKLENDASMADVKQKKVEEDINTMNNAYDTVKLDAEMSKRRV